MATLSVILTPQIEKVSKDYLAGTERMFLKDIDLLKKRYQLSIFSRTKITPQTISIPFKFPRWMSLLFSLPPRFSFLEEELENFFYGLHVCIRHFYKKNDFLVSYSFPLIAIFLPKKSLIFLHDFQTLPHYNLFSKRYKKTRFVCCSNSLRKQYLKYYPDLSSDRFFTLHNSIDPAVYKRSRTQSAPSPKIIFLYASAWVPQKGLLELLNAFSLLDDTLRSKACLFIASNERLWSADDEKRYHQYINKVKIKIDQLKNTVRTLNGIQSKKMPRTYQQCDWLVFPSIWDEPFGLVLLESIACGVPVVAFNSGAVSEILSHSNSIIVNKKTPKALAETLSKIIRKQLRKDTHSSLLTPKNSDMLDANREKKLFDLLESTQMS